MYSTNLPEVAARLGVCPAVQVLQRAPQRAPDSASDVSARVPQALFDEVRAVPPSYHRSCQLHVYHVSGKVLVLGFRSGDNT